ncbi:Nitric oxide oxidoreductase [Taxawa tesnikishii (nom. ined.)]|nr:Nitric oxide oxidoreductase [Dothideales sp. JES 119]
MAPLTQDQVKTIKATVPVLKDHGNDITKNFYATLLKENPDLNNVFNQANQVNGHQAGALAGSLYAYATHIDDLGALSPAVEKICHKHASLYIKPEHYDIVGTYLLRSMKDILGDALTQDIHDAWATAYWQLADIMIGREKQLLSDAQGWTSWRDMRIAKKVPESAEITSFYLSPVDSAGKLPPFLPGQYISVMTDVPDLKYMQSRQYSLSDAPNESYYRISVKKDPGLDMDRKGAKYHPGYISNILHSEKQVGDTVLVSHPYGDFFLDPKESDTGPVVLMSAGVGLTPMISILNTLLQQGSKRRLSWIHGTRSTAAQAFGQHIKDVVTEHKNVHAVVFNKRPGEKDVEGRDYNHVGRVSIEKLDKEEDLCLGEKGTTYYICGPDSFMVDMAKGLKGLGVEEERVKEELFGTGEIPKN